MVDAELALGPAREALTETVVHNMATVDQLPLIVPLDVSLASAPAALHALHPPVLVLRLTPRRLRLLRRIKCLRMGLVVERKGTPA